MSKQTTMVHQVFGGYYRSQGKNHRIYFLLASCLVKIGSIRSRIGESWRGVQLKKIKLVKNGRNQI